MNFSSEMYYLDRSVAYCCSRKFRWEDPMDTKEFDSIRYDELMNVGNDDDGSGRVG